MNDHIKNYIPKLESNVFGGTQIKKISDSLYVVNQNIFLLPEGEYDGYVYFFTMLPQHVHQTEFFVLVLENDQIALKIPTNFVKQRLEYFNLRSENYFVIAEYVEDSDACFLRTNQDIGLSEWDNVDQFRFNITSVEDIQAMAIGLRHLILGH